MFVQKIFENLKNNPAKAYVSEVRGPVLMPATGDEIRQRIAAGRATLRSQGVKPGDRVVLIAPNSIDWVATDLSILAEGAIVVPMYARQDPTELLHMIRDCDPVLTVLADGVEVEGAPNPIALDAFLASDPIDVDEAPFAGTDDDAVTIIYTSGTSGEPKGVVITRGNVDYMLPNTAGGLQRMMGTKSADDRVFHYLPFCFAGSRIVLWTCLFRDNGIMVSTDLNNLVEEFGTARPNYFLNVPALLLRLQNGVEAKLRDRAAPIQWLYERGRDAFFKAKEERGLRDRIALRLADRILFKSIKEKIGPELECLICGSAPLGEDTQRWFEMLGIPVYQVYGLTETTAIVTMDRPPEPCIPGRVGHALDGCETKIGDGGEMLVRSPGIFKEYWNKPEATEAAFLDGWFRTGDQVEVDASGSWRIVGRVKNILVPSSGHNVAPEPIEQRIIETIEGVQTAVVVGHARPFLAAIVAGEALDVETVQSGIDRINSELPHYRRIRAFHVTAEEFTPESGLVTATQKLRRAEIEQHFSGDIDGLYGQAK